MLMLKQLLAVVAALIAFGCGASLAFSIMVVVTRFVFDMRVLVIMLTLTAGMIASALLSRLFYRMAVRDGGFPVSRMIGIAVTLIVCIGAVYALYNWGALPFMAFAERKPMIALGIALVAVPCLLAYPVNYFVNVRNTSEGGTVMVSGFLGYIGHGLANLAATIILGGSVLVGMLMIFAFGLFG